MQNSIVDNIYVARSQRQVGREGWVKGIVEGTGRVVNGEGKAVNRNVVQNGSG